MFPAGRTRRSGERRLHRAARGNLAGSWSGRLFGRFRGRGALRNRGQAQGAAVAGEAVKRGPAGVVESLSAVGASPSRR
jgi:hypothetical protein